MPSILEKINFSTTQQFLLDYVHLVCLGVTKKMIQIYIDKYYKKQKRQFDNFNKFYVEIRASIPLEFSRKTRSFNEVHRWKAVEFRTFLLYLGPIVLQNILNDTEMKHFNSLHSAIRIL